MKKLTIFFILFNLAGCANFTKNSYKSLAVTSELYNVTMETVVDLQGQGVIDSQKRNEINQIALIYYDAHHAALDALELYLIVEDKESKEKAIDKIRDVTKAINVLIEHIKPYLKMKGGDNHES